MDLGALLRRNEAGSGSSTGSASSTRSSSSFGGGSNSDANNEGPAEGGRRGELFQKIRKGMHATHAETRALRASESHNRRSVMRDKIRSKNRVQASQEEVFDENEENRNANETAQREEASKKSRREMLEEFRLKKLRDKEMQKKTAKPAFKVGWVHHPLAPIGAGAMKPNEYDKNLTKKTNPNLSTMSRNTTLQRSTVRPGPSTRILPGPTKGNQVRNNILGRKKVEAAPKRPAPRETVQKDNKTKPVVEKQKQLEVPQIMLTPAPEDVRTTRSQSSQSSTGSLSKASFAPDNYEFKPINIPTVSTPLKQHTALSIRTVSSVSSGMGTSDDDNVFYDVTDKKIEQSVFYSAPEDVEMQIPEPANSTLTPERGRTRSRRSRRISGIQPDRNIPVEELVKTPARKVKERSLSSTRRSTIRYSPSDFETENQDTGVSSPVRNGDTPAKTPRTARKMSKVTTLPVLSESSPSHEETGGESNNDEKMSNEKEAPVTSLRRSTKKSTVLEPQNITPKQRKSTRKFSISGKPEIVSSEEEEIEMSSSRTRKSTRISAVQQVMDTPEVESEAVTKPTPRRSRRGSALPPKPEEEMFEPTPRQPERRVTKSETSAEKSKDMLQAAVLLPSPGLSKTASPRASPRPRMGVLVSSIRRSSRISNIHSQVNNEEKEIQLQITEEITETVVEKIEEIPVKNDTTEDHTNVEMSENTENAGNDEERDLVTPVRSSTRKSGVRPMEINNQESEPNTEAGVNTPEPTKPDQGFVFKTPNLKSLIKRPKSTSRKPRGTPSPYVEERRSVKRKYSLSETKPKSSIYSMFDDIPESDSPVHELLAKKFRSSDHVSSEEVEEILAQFRVQRLSDTFTRMGQEEDELNKKEALESTQECNETRTNNIQEEPAVNHIEKMDVEKPVCEEEDKPILVMAKAVEGQEESQHDVPYFRNLLVSETARITSICDEWEAKIGPTIPDDIQGQIRSVVGQGRLIMAERFKQFSGLVDNCEFGTGERTTSCMDLEGFWDMIYFQVIDVDKKFEELTKIEQNDWKEIIPEIKRVAPKKKVVKKNVSASENKPGASGLRAHIMAQRKAAAAKSESGEVEKSAEKPAAAAKSSIRDLIAAKRAAMQKSTSPKIVVTESSAEKKPEGEMREFDGGFFSVKSPARPASTEMKRSPLSPGRSRSPGRSAPASPASGLTPSSKGLSTGGDRLRRAVLTDSARRLSGMVSPFVSQMARRSLGPVGSADNQQQAVAASPGTSSKPVRRSTLFDDMEENEELEKENNETDNNTENNAIDDPVIPIVSPVKKTYSHDHSFDASTHEQEMEKQFDLLLSNGHQDSMDLDTAAGRFDSILRDNDSAKKGLLDLTPGVVNNAEPIQPTRSSTRKSRNVKFASSTANSLNESSSLETTPHPKSTRRSSRRLQNDENISPNLIDFE